MGATLTKPLLAVSGAALTAERRAANLASAHSFAAVGKIDAAIFAALCITVETAVRTSLGRERRLNKGKDGDEEHKESMLRWSVNRSSL